MCNRDAKADSRVAVFVCPLRGHRIAKLFSIFPNLSAPRAHSANHFPGKSTGREIALLRSSVSSLTSGDSIRVEAPGPHERPKAPNRPGLAILATLLLPLLSLLVLFAVGELGLRGYYSWRYNMPFFAGSMGNVPLVTDPMLGWRPNEQYRFVSKQSSIDGTVYEVKGSLKSGGFRMVGDLQSPRPKIFVIGDSFTQAVEVSDDKTYYAVFQGKVPAEIFAYGGGGYGSLQEHMIMDRYLDRIHPDLIVWQYMSNDFMNNSPELERASTINNNGMVRPYLVDGRISYIMPRSHPKLREAITSSRLGDLLLIHFDRLFAQTASVENEIGRVGSRHPGFRRSVQITDQIMQRVSARAKGIPIIAFCADGTEPYFSALRDISLRNGIEFVDAVPKAIQEAEQEGKVVRARDGYHWNNEGHRIAGDVLGEYLGKRGLAVKRKP